MNGSEEGQRILEFYDESAPDDRGRFLRDILSRDDEWLEWTHDFIQWLFPTMQRSGANPDAPVLDDASVAAFRVSEGRRSALLRSLDRMLAFYGLLRDGVVVSRDASFRDRAQWLSANNHNHARLTRILTSLRLLGEERLAQTLFSCLRDIDAEERRSGRRSISDLTMRLWAEAVQS
jgi:hypothetical protein